MLKSSTRLTISSRILRYDYWESRCLTRGKSMFKAQYTHNVEKGLTLLLLCIVCARATAADHFIYLGDFENFGIKEDDFHKMPILATHQMDNETLFLAAEAERDNSMSLEHRLINNRWLLDRRDASYSGPEALRRYLRLFFIQSWKAKRAKEQRDIDAYGMIRNIRSPKPSQFRDISNYRFKASDNRVQIRFRYRFN